MQQFTEQVAMGVDLAPEQVRKAIGQLLAPEIGMEEKAGFLKALHGKGESAAEIHGFVEVLLEHAVDPRLDFDKLPGPTIDLCGTGGDRKGLFNVSTTAMFVVAAAGAVVVKHGNRSITSKCGGADVLEALGVRIDLSPDLARRGFEEIGVGFLFAPQYHPAFQVIGPIRKKLAEEGVTTIFNLLGPLLNPARPQHQLVGIFNAQHLGKYAQALAALGRKKAWVVHGEGCDEITIAGTTFGRELTARGEVRAFELNPEQMGAEAADLEELEGGDIELNKQIVLSLLDGSLKGAKREMVLVNSAGALIVCGIATNWPEAMDLATRQIESGRALEKLNQLRAFGEQAG